MLKQLLSLGLDVGTTTTQLVLSELTVENQASSFTVPRMEITKRKIVYRSPVRFTPITSRGIIDGEEIKSWVEQQYAAAGVQRQQVDTGAIIVTGETSRKENAEAVLHALSSFAGDFVVATAGPDLESVLAAKGAGAQSLSEKVKKDVLHMDIGGGTSNLALLRDGQILRTGCFNVGGRLLKFGEDGKVSYVSDALKGVMDFQVGEHPSREKTRQLATLLAEGLEMAAGLRPATKLLEKLCTKEVQQSWLPPQQPVAVSFSGGVADCIEKSFSPRSFGDIGPELGQAIYQSRLCQGEYTLGTETIRATVIGAGCHSARLSGSTVFYRNVSLPMKNLPVAIFTRQEQEDASLPELISRRVQQAEGGAVVLAMPGVFSPTYEAVAALADAIAKASCPGGVYVCLEADMAKALGHALSLRLPRDTPCMCIDSVPLTAESYLDIGVPVGPCLPVVIKTLVLEREKGVNYEVENHIIG